MFVLRVNGSLSARYERRLSLHTSSIVVNTPVSIHAQRCTAVAGTSVLITPDSVVRHVEPGIAVSRSEARMVSGYQAFQRYASRALLFNVQRVAIC